jgi:hypothetical protein
MFGENDQRMQRIAAFLRKHLNPIELLDFRQAGERDQQPLKTTRRPRGGDAGALPVMLFERAQDWIETAPLIMYHPLQ